jgi:amino-acid N-acetyltransferase
LLAASGLPTEDITAAAHPEFLIMRSNGHLGGVIGLERFGPTGLLRSLAVRPEHRRAGFGIALTRALEEHAARSGVLTLYLLTQTAQAFFSHRGYRAIERDQAPDEIRSNPQFRSLCPASAVLMRRDLGTALQRS